MPWRGLARVAPVDATHQAQQCDIVGILPEHLLGDRLGLRQLSRSGEEIDHLRADDVRLRVAAQGGPVFRFGPFDVLGPHELLGELVVQVAQREMVVGCAAVLGYGIAFRRTDPRLKREREEQQKSGTEAESAKGVPIGFDRSGRQAKRHSLRLV